MKIKICGIKTLDEFSQICDLKFDFFGLIFAPSKRQVSVKTAKQIIEFGKKFDKLPVLVFATSALGGSSFDEILEICKELKPFAAQIYGDFELDFKQNLNDLGIKVWKVYSIKDEIPKLNNAFFDLPLFDCKGEKLGGNGVSFDFNILQNLEQKSFIIAGGLGAKNVKFASSFLPFALDINSLVEDEFGLKSRQKIVEILEILDKNV